MNKIQINKTAQPRISQGDIFRDVELIEDIRISGGDIVITRLQFPAVFVLTQDCDLESDYDIRWSGEQKATQDQQLISVLVAPVYNSLHLFEGSHLEDLKLKMERQNSDRKKLIMQNQNQRYHYFDPGQAPLPPSVIDFKHYFSMSVTKLKDLKDGHWVFKVAEIYREQICQRFANYLSRIGLPEERVKKNPL